MSCCFSLITSQRTSVNVYDPDIFKCSGQLFFFPHAGRDVSPRGPYFPHVGFLVRGKVESRRTMRRYLSREDQARLSQERLGLPDSEVAPRM